MKEQVRWMIRRDVAYVMYIEKATCVSPWDEDMLVGFLRQRNAIGMVVDIAGEIAGYMLYELHKNKLRLVKLAVRPAFKRQGVGEALIRRLKDKLSQQRRREIEMEVRERDLETQLLMKREGFRCYQVLRGYFENIDVCEVTFEKTVSFEDSYSMRYCLTAEDDIFSPLSARNRIADYDDVFDN